MRKQTPDVSNDPCTCSASRAPYTLPHQFGCGWRPIPVTPDPKPAGVAHAQLAPVEPATVPAAVTAEPVPTKPIVAETPHTNGHTPAPFAAVQPPAPIAAAAVDAIRAREATEIAQLRSAVAVAKEEAERSAERNRLLDRRIRAVEHILSGHGDAQLAAFESGETR